MAWQIAATISVLSILLAIAIDATNAPWSRAWRIAADISANISAIAFFGSLSTAIIAFIWQI